MKLNISRGYVSRFLLFLLLTLATGVQVSSQTMSADSIRKEIAALHPGDPKYLENKANALGTLLQVVKYSDQDEALRLSDELAEIYFQLGDSIHAYEAKFRYKAIIYEQIDRFDLVLVNQEAYAEALNRINKKNGYVYLDIGNVYFNFGLFNIAKENYQKAEEIFGESDTYHGLCTIYNNYAQIEMYLGNNDSALYWLRKSYNTRKNLMKDTVLAAESRLLMAKVLREKGELDASLAEGKHVLAVLHSPDFNKHPDHIELREEFVGVYPGIGITYTELKQWDSATHYFAQGEKLFLESKNETRLPGLYAGWAEMYFAKGVPDSVLYYIKKGEAYETISPITKLRLLELYANYYQLTGNMEKSYMYRMNYYRMADSLQASGNKEQMLMAGSRVQQLLNTSRIDRQNIELAQKDMVALERERERVSLFIIAGALLLVVLVAALSVFQLRKKNKLIGRYNRALESANATKEQFLSVISHDLRGPFNTLIGMSNVLVSNVREKNYAQVSDNAELINESSRKAYVLLDNLMQWVSLQKEGIQVSRAEIPMNELIDEVLRLFRGQALAQSITIAKDIRLGRAFTDKNLLQVILRNLISNAIRHIPVGGRVQLTITHEGHDVHIVVEDNGDGFTDEALEGLFPQEADGTSIARKGGGLGLILVGQFVRQLGGTITAANAPSGGARFTIILADAALPDGEEPGLQSSSTHSYLALTDEDKQALAPLIAQVQDYEIFDTTELRALLEKNGVPETSSIIEWRRQMLQAVYHADETKLRRLIESATS